MHLPPISRLLGVLAIVFTVGALLLPMSAIELLAVPLIVAGAYFGGLRGGLLTAIWAMLVTSAAYLLTQEAHSGDFAVSLVAYAAVGVGLGAASIGSTHSGRVCSRRSNASNWPSANSRRASGDTSCCSRAATTPCICTVLTLTGSRRRFVAVNDAACARLGYTREELLGLHPAGDRRGAQARAAASA